MRINVKSIYDYENRNDSGRECVLLRARSRDTHTAEPIDRHRCLVTVDAQYVHHVDVDKKALFAGRQYRFTTATQRHSGVSTPWVSYQLAPCDWTKA